MPSAPIVRLRGAAAAAAQLCVRWGERDCRAGRCCTSTAQTPDLDEPGPDQFWRGADRDRASRYELGAVEESVTGELRHLGRCRPQETGQRRKGARSERSAGRRGQLEPLPATLDESALGVRRRSCPSHPFCGQILPPVARIPGRTHAGISRGTPCRMTFGPKRAAEQVRRSASTAWCMLSSWARTATTRRVRPI